MSIRRLSHPRRVSALVLPIGHLAFVCALVLGLSACQSLERVGRTVERDDASTIGVQRSNIDVSDLEGLTVGGTIIVSIEAEGWMREVHFYLDGVLGLTLDGPPFEYEIDTTELTDGEHTLGYEAVMPNGRVRDSETVPFFVDNADASVEVVIVSGEGGVVVAAPEGPYHVGDVVAFAAVAAEGFAHLAWGDACAAVAVGEECGLELEGDVVVSATFALVPEPDPQLTENSHRALELGAVMIHAATRDGVIWRDESGNGLHGTVVNDPVWHETGGPGPGLPGFFAFDAGLRQYVDVGHDAVIAFTGPHALAWWERNGTGPQVDGHATRLGKGDRGYIVRRHNEVSLRYFVRDGASSEAMVTSGDFLDGAKWTMVVARFDGSEGTLWSVADGTATRVAGRAASGLMPDSAEDHFAYAAQDNRRLGEGWRRWRTGELAGGLAFDYALSTTEMAWLAAAALEETSPPSSPSEPDPVAPIEPYPDPQTVVGIVGEDWYINGVIVNPGSQAEGLLMNSRMVQATFEDENPSTVHEWEYPDSSPYDPQRQTDEFVAMVPTYAAKGLNAVTVSLQGGRPRSSGAPYGRSQPWINTAFTTDGSIKPGYMERMAQVIEALDQHGMVAILSYFYFGQDDHFPNEAAIFTAVENATQWVVDKGYTNVVIELANEVGHWQWSHDIFSNPDRAHEMIAAARAVGPNLLYGCSLGGGYIPPDSLIAAADFHLPHGNNQTASRVVEMVEEIRNSSSYGGEPIDFNEDSADLANLYAAVGAGAGWGYYDQGANDYHTGFQSPPTNWAINTPEKIAFFAAVEQLTTEAREPEPIAYVDAAKNLGAVLVLNQERSGGRWLDESGNDLHGSEHNAPAWHASGGPMPGIPGFYRFVEASQQHIDVGDDPLLRFTNAMTIVWWERHGNQSGGVAHHVRIGKGDDAYQIRRDRYATDTVRFTVRNDRSVYEGDIVASDATSDEWQMYMVRYDGNQITLHRIVDGSAVHIASTDYSGGIEANTDLFAIAAQHDGVGWRRWWSGDMAGLLAFPVALSAAQLEELHAAAQQESGASSPTTPGDDEFAAQTGMVHEPYLAWQVVATDYGARNAYDVEATATFTRRGGDTYSVPLYYAGGNTFEFRFTGPRTGTYDINTSSPHSDTLNGLTGIATITSNPNPDAKGFMTTVANADGTGSFAYLHGDDGTPRRMLYNPQVRAATTTDPVGFSHLWVGLGGLTEEERGARIEANLDHMEAHGFHAIEFNVAHNFVQWGLTNRQTSTSTEPDPYTFAVIEDLLERALARGRFMHIWAWSDQEAGGSTADLQGGINGYVDQRVQRMLVGRLGAYPNWAMSYGYDLEEYVTAEQLRAWHAGMQALGTLPRLYMAREADDRAPSIVLDLGMDKLDVFSWDGRPESGWYADALAQFGNSPPGMALIYERRFWSDRDDVWYEDVARRAAWQFSMANGASAIFGQGRSGTSATPEYEHPEIWKTLHDFWEHRFAFPLVVDSAPADGMVLSDSDRSVVYKEGASSVKVDVKRADSQVVAVSTSGAYVQYDLGLVDAGERTITLPGTGNWVVAVGDFGATGELIDPPAEPAEPSSE